MIRFLGSILFTAIFLSSCRSTAEKLPAPYEALKESCQLIQQQNGQPFVFRHHWLGQPMRTLNDQQLDTIFTDSLGKVFELCPDCTVEYYRQLDGSQNQLQSIVVNCQLDSPQEAKILFDAMFKLLSEAYQTPAQRKGTTAYFWNIDSLPLKIELILLLEYHSITLNYAKPLINSTVLKE